MAQAQAQATREVQQSVEASREDKQQQQQQSKEKKKTGHDGAKSDSTRKRVQQLAVEANAEAHEALKKVAALEAEMAKNETQAGEYVAQDDDATETEQQEGCKKSAKLFSDQSPGSNYNVEVEANGEKEKEETNGAPQPDADNGARSTNGCAVAGQDQGLQNGSNHAAVPADTINPGLDSSLGESVPGSLDLNQCLQGSKLAGAAQVAQQAVEQAAGLARTTPAPQPPLGPAPMQQG